MSIWGSRGSGIDRKSPLPVTRDLEFEPGLKDEERNWGSSFLVFAS